MDERRAVVAALVLGRLAFGYQLEMPASLGPTLLQALGLDFAGLGALMGSYMLPGVFASLPGGLLGRRIGERSAVCSGLLLMAIGGLLSGATATAGMVAAGRALSGIGAVMLVVMQGAVLSARFEGRSFLMALGLVLGAFPIGIGLAGLTAQPLAAALGWRAPILLGAVPAALAGVVMLVACRSDAAKPSGGWGLPGWRECVSVVAMGTVYAVYNGGYYAFLVYLPPLLAARGHPPGTAAVVTALATWPNLPFMMLGGSLADRLGQKRVFLIGTGFFIAFLLATTVVDAPVLWGALLGTLGALHAGVIVGVATLASRPENRAVGMGVFYSVFYAGSAFLPAVCGVAADRAGRPDGALWAAAAITAIGVPIWLVHDRLGRRRVASEADQDAVRRHRMARRPTS